MPVTMTRSLRALPVLRRLLVARDLPAWERTVRACTAVARVVAAGATADGAAGDAAFGGFMRPSYNETLRMRGI
jgi:hypothetical protein